jgi:hypothetical protein
VNISRSASVLLLLALAALTGCASLANRAGERMAGNLTRAVLDQDDPATVRDGLPAYLLLLDGLIEGSPDSPAMLLAGARLYSAYAGSFVAESERARRLSARGLDYARRGVCAGGLSLCGAGSGDFEAFERALAGTRANQAGALFALGSAWATWIQANRDDWNAIADLPRVEALFERLLELDPMYAGGEPYMYLGVLHCLRPEALGGRPQLGRERFERAIALSGGSNLMARVLMAEHYARLVFERELHDGWLREALEADPRAPGYTLGNVLAQQRAEALLASADDYF